MLEHIYLTHYLILRKHQTIPILPILPTFKYSIYLQHQESLTPNQTYPSKWQRTKPPTSLPAQHSTPHQNLLTNKNHLQQHNLASISLTQRALRATQTNRLHTLVHRSLRLGKIHYRYSPRATSATPRCCCIQT